jgi:hypothetical protein
MIVKYVGLTAETAALIEGRRQSPGQLEDDIILCALRPPSPPDHLSEPYDLGQGVTVYVGEKLALFLNERDKRRREPVGFAEVRRDGLYVDDRKVGRSRGSEITPAMRTIQERVDHRAFGKLVSLNAYLKFHVVRRGMLVPLAELKDPALARKRGRRVTDEQADRFLGEIGLGDAPAGA